MLKYFYLILICTFTSFAAMAQHPKQAVDLYNKAVILKEKGMFLESLDFFRKAIAVDKKYDSAYLGLASLYATVSVPDSSILLLNTAVKIMPAFTSGYMALGNLYRDVKHEIDSAIINYQKVLSLDSTEKAALYGMAWCYNNKGNNREAITYAVKALDIDNNYRPAYSELGHAYNKLKAYEECVAQFKKNLAISVNDLPMLYMGYAYMEMNQNDNVLKMIDQLKTVNPRMAESLQKRLAAKQQQAATGPAQP
ncbi:tetratricopeptide repeat protein [Ferruginibacter sp.]